MRKLIALDIDGTLITDDRNIPEANKLAIKEAQDAGHVVMLCSGRPHDGLIKFAEEEGLGELPISGSNGSATLVDGELIHRVYMTAERVRELYHYFDQKNYPMKIYTNVGIFAPADFLKRAKALYVKKYGYFGMLKKALKQYGTIKEVASKYPFTPLASIDELFAMTENLEVYKFFILTPQSSEHAVIRDFTKAMTDLTVTSSHSDNIEISDIKGHKGTGLTAVAAHFNIPMEATVAMGDNFNDIGMLEVAGLSVAMGNAEDDVKKMCDVVTLTNNDAGVAHALREYVLK